MMNCDGISCCQVGFQIWPATSFEVERLALDTLTIVTLRYRRVV